jgi:release factor glutamine methyltransferase
MTGRADLASFRTAISCAARTLARAGVDSPRRDAEILLCHVLGEGRTALFMRASQVMTPAQAAAYRALVARRAAREPVSRLVGTRGFWRHEFIISPDVLDPRPDSECLIETVLGALARRRGEALRVLDLGVGSGCLLLSLLAEWPRARGVGVDISPPALAVARANAVRLGLAGRAHFVAGDWFAALSPAARFDVIISNPPYIASGDIAGLAPEVARHEPRPALDGGDDGLAAYRALTPHLGASLAAGGLAALEVGAGQAAAVGALLARCGARVDCFRDLGGVERCLVARFD